MTSEGPNRATTDPTREVTTAERVLLSKWSIALDELKPNDPLPDLNRAELSKPAQVQYDDLLLKVAEKQSQKGAAGIVTAASLIRSIRKNTPVQSAALDALDRANEKKAHEAFEQAVSKDTNLKTAYLLQEHFFQYRSEFLEVCEKNKDKIRHAMTRESWSTSHSTPIGENMRIGFQLLPSLREDPELKNTVREMFSVLNKKTQGSSSHDKMSQIVRACPRNYFTLEDLLPFRDWLEAEVEAWTGLEKDWRGDAKPSSMHTFPFSDKEKEEIIETVINAKLWSGKLESAQAIATALKAEDVLATKASELYLRYLNKDEYECKLTKLDALVPESTKNTPEVIALKRKWGLAHIKHHYASQRYGYLSQQEKADFAETYKKQFDIEESLLNTSEARQQVQQQILEALRNSGYADAAKIYDAFLAESSKSPEFQKQMEQAVLEALGEAIYPRIGKERPDTKALDLLSAEFRNSPAFREFVPVMLSNAMDRDSQDEIEFVIDKLNCSPEEIRLAKQNSLVKAFTYSDPESLVLRPTGDSTHTRIKETINKIQPDEELVKTVRTKLNDAVLKSGNLSQLQLWEWYGQFLGTSQKQIRNQPEAKVLVVQHLETEIRQNNVGGLTHLIDSYNLTKEDVGGIDKATIIQAIEWWLTEQYRRLAERQDPIIGDIKTIIELCELQEQVIQDENIRALGARFLLASHLLWNEKEWVKKSYQEGLLITDEEMAHEASEVAALLLKHTEHRDRGEMADYLKEMRKLLPNLPKGFADRVLGDAFLSKMDSYFLPEDSEFGRNYGYGRRNERVDISDHLIDAMNLMETYEARSRIATQAVNHILTKGAYECAHDLISKRKVDSYLDKKVWNELLVPHYLNLLGQSERQAKSFAGKFGLSLESIDDAQVTEVYLQLFKDAITKGYPEGIIEAAENLKAEQIKSALANSPEIRSGIEAAFTLEFKLHGFDSRFVEKTLDMGLMQSEFLNSPQIKEAGMRYIQTHLVKMEFEKILFINSKLGLNLAPRDIIAMEPGNKNLFESIEQNFPTLAQKCVSSLDTLFSLLPYFKLITPDVVREDPFLVEALQENERFGPKLLIKFNSLDLLSKGNIRTLYKSKKEILGEHKNMEVDSREFRMAMQEKLFGYRRNPEILNSLQKNGINVEEWLGYEEEMYFQLGRDESQKFSEAIVTPIERMQDTLNAYALNVKEILAVYKEKLIAFDVPLKDPIALQSELDKLKAETARAEREGNSKKIEGIAKGIAKLEAQIREAKTISLWEKIMSELSLLDLVKKDVYKAYEALTDTEAAYEKTEADKTFSSSARRNELKKIKDKMVTAKNELEKKVKLLGVRLAEFDNKFGELVTPALGTEQSDSLVREKNERVGEDVDHYESDSRTLENLFHEKADQGLVGHTMKIAIWDRNPDQDLYLGNYTDCCIRIDSGHMGSESTIADYLTDVGVQVVTITDEKNTTPVVAAWCWIGHDDNDQVSFVVDNIEANTDYSANYRKQLEAKLLEFLSSYSKKVGAKLVQGQINNDLVVAKMDSAYFKLGGYNRPSGYYLEGEGSGAGHNDEEFGGDE